MASEMLTRLGFKPIQSDELEYVYDDRGRPVAFKGLNGKLWAVPRGWEYYGIRENYEGLSAAACGWPQLNDDEQAAYDLILPLVSKLGDEMDERQSGMIDSMGDVEGEWFYRKGINSSFAVDATAFRIAEQLVANGWKKTDMPRE